MKRFRYSLGALALLAAAAYASSPVKVETDNGVVLAGFNSRMTLYQYEKDTDGVPTCYDECAKRWPPHLAEYWDQAREPFSIVDRKDGKKQWAKDGMPLYFSTLDEKKGDTNGDGVDGVWKAARP